MTEIRTKGQLAKQASYKMNTLTTAQKNAALQAIAQQLRDDCAQIVESNKIDLQNGATAGLPSSTLDRILLNEQRIHAMADAILLLIDLPDPVGELLEDFTKDNGLHVQKVRVPLGVVAMIYEARPNVTVDAATLCLKTGNAVVLRGSSSAKHSNIALVKAIHDALAKTDCPVDAVQLIEDTSREAAAELFHLKEYIDVLIPRGGAALINLVVREASVPVLETGAGNCHVFIDHSAPVDMTTSIVLNAKTQRPSVCNAAESLLIEKSWLQTNGSALLETLHDAGVHIIGDEHVRTVFSNAQAATDEDWATEYLDYTISVKTVEDVFEAITHINTYGTHHSEAIITMNDDNAQHFLRNVDAAAVYHNASTRFTDGFEYGYGAEIGISTQKLHARGPMGLPALTSTKYIGIGTGQIR
ncbi:glutamate-5-semialdehyde dehydrogenase [Caryophanon latum]|uniref:Gamma-glutamyl phosphate reductase n=1 Tax=Caryophanon latum TaxID=33977 RepID=A0A1C0YTP3_9BACL|nr:glutamate-5-semialdehyde dehydrogenase [Caryophanon latum]OCS90523.1 glutamate-5-semialdehyde dehydrogenase [Caryophanon latum]